MAIGKNKLIEELRAIIAEDNRIHMQQNKKIVMLEEENKRLKKYVSLLEACVNKGVEIHLPNTEAKERNADDTGSIDFTDLF